MVMVLECFHREILHLFLVPHIRVIDNHTNVNPLYLGPWLEIN